MSAICPLRGDIMHTEYNSPSKTLGPQAARLVVELHERGRPTFSLEEVSEITGLPEKSTRQFMQKLVERGIAARLRPGLYSLVPFEMGREREYLGNPYLVARELTRTEDYFVSHASAMDLHQMVTQPQLVVYASSPRQIRGRKVLGMEFRFVRIKLDHLFGTTEMWIDKRETVVVSDLERTIVDGLKHPAYCGGFTETAKGLWMRREDIDVGRLVEYALRLDVGAVIRRLGFLLEIYEIDAPQEIRLLRRSLTNTYHWLDPTLPHEGPSTARWRLRMNISPEEILRAPTT